VPLSTGSAVPDAAAPDPALPGVLALGALVPAVVASSAAAAANWRLASMASGGWATSREGLRETLPGRHQRGPVGQGEVALDCCAQVRHGAVEVAGGQRGDAQGMVRRAETGDARTAGHRPVRVRAEEFVCPRGGVGIVE
jgi:hypothetical protein